MPTTVSGNIKNLATGAVGSSSNAFVRFWLRGCRGNQPRIIGTGAIAPQVHNGQWYVDLLANSSGVVSGSIYSTRDAAGTGNGEIEVGGSKTAVWYGMVVYSDGVPGPEIPVHAKNGATLDISNVTAISTPAVSVAPDGDTTYLRLDGGNGPVTGSVQFNAITGSGEIKSTANPVDIRAHGALVDGATDDSVAVAAAITEAALTGASVFFPNGTTLVNSTIALPDNPVALIGESMMGAKIKAGAAMTAIISKTSTTRTFGFQIKNLTLDGNLLATSLMNIVGAKAPIISDIYGIRPANAGNGFVFGDATADTYFYEAKIQNIELMFEDADFAAADVPVYGIHLMTSATDNHLRDIVVKNPQTAGILDEGGNNLFHMIHVYGYPLTTYYPDYGLILNHGGLASQIYTDGANTAGIKLAGTSGQVVGCRLYWPASAPVSGAYPVEVADSVVSCVISNNIARNLSGVTKFVNFLGTPPTEVAVFGNQPAYDDVSLRNSQDVALNVRLDAGGSAAQNVKLYFSDRGTSKWIISKSSAGAFTLEDGADSFKFRQIFNTGAITELNSGGTSEVQLNVRNGSGTGGTKFGDGAGSTVASVDSAGKATAKGMVIDNTAAPTAGANQVGLGSTTATTVGAAGGASALPATPTGYLIVNIGGTNFKIPYYAN